MANSVDPDQTAPVGAVCSGSVLFASTLNLSVMLGNYLQQTTSADNIFRCIYNVYSPFLSSATNILAQPRVNLESVIMKICIYVHVLLSVTNGFWSICCFMRIMQCCFAHIPSKSENATLHFFVKKYWTKSI